MNISMLSTIIPYGNKGDEAIYETSVQLVRRYCPKSEISLVSFSTPGFELNHRQIHNLYGFDRTISYPAGVVDSFAKVLSRYGQAPNRLVSRANRFWYWDLYPFFPTLKLPRRLRFNGLGDASIFIVVGHPLVKGLLPICLRAYSMKMMHNKPTIVFPFSISLHPFSRPNALDYVVRHNVITLLSKMDVLLLREKYSLQYLRKKSGLESTLILSADTSFLLRSADEKSTLKKLERMSVFIQKPAIAVCPRGDYFRNALVRENYEDFIHMMSNLIDELIEQLCANVYFVPMTSDEDFSVISDIRRLIKHRGKSQIVDTKYMSAEEVKTLFSHMDLLITMRLHAAILAASSFVPSLLMMTTQDLKSVGVMEDLGLSEYFVNLNSPDFDARKMLDTALNLYSNLEGKKKLLKERLPLILRRVELSGEYLKNFV